MYTICDAFWIHFLQNAQILRNRYVKHVSKIKTTVMPLLITRGAGKFFHLPCASLFLGVTLKIQMFDLFDQENNVCKLKI